jgi:acetolactate synthase small subunit
MTARLRISADDQEGVLQRIIFEFSRRNISIEKLIFSRECSFNIINVDVKNDGDA